jgi:3-hydroxy acid dehydrogenase / malonic semialdehyde reductase
MNPIVLITGASSGFGKATAEKFAAGGFDLILTGRRKERMDDLKTHLQSKFQIRVYVTSLDVRDREAVFKAVYELPEDWKNIGILVNNAGLALGRDYFDEANLDDWETMIDTNVNGLLYVSKAVIPLMSERKKGHIINIGSTAGKEVYEKGNVYCASKFAVNAISEAMRIDLLRHHIKVTCINPGAADTEFSNVRFKGNDQLAGKVYEGYKPLVASDISEVIFFCASLPAHVCINELTMTCLAQANSFYLHKDF